MEPERLVERQLVAEVRRLGIAATGMCAVSPGGTILPETVAVSSITSFMVPQSSRSMIVGPYRKGAADWVSNATVILAHLVDLVPGDHMAEGLEPCAIARRVGQLGREGELLRTGAALPCRPPPPEPAAPQWPSLPLDTQVVTVAYAEPKDDVVRVISARMATRIEEEAFYRRAGGRKR